VPIVDVCTYNIILYDARIFSDTLIYVFRWIRKINTTVWKFSRLTLTTHTLYRIHYALYLYLIRKSGKLSAAKIVANYSELSHADRVSFFLRPVWKYRTRLLWRFWRLRRGKDYYRTTITTTVNAQKTIRTN